MTQPTAAQQRAWMAQWRSAAVALERVRVDEMLRADLGSIARDLEDVSLVAAPDRARATTSGLIAQQALLHGRRPPR
jgi:hypothetical protein